MLKHVINDFAVLKPVIGSDEYNSDIFGNSKTIKCKIEFAKKPDTSQTFCRQSHPARMFCYEDVNLNDIVTYQNIDYKVIQVNSYKDLDGKPMFYEVFLI